MTEGNQVEREEAGEEEEEEEAQTLVTLDALRVASIHILQLLDRIGFLEGAEDEGGNAKGENDEENEGETEKDRVDSHPHILNQTVPELEGVLLNRLHIEEESAHRDVGEHS